MAPGKLRHSVRLFESHHIGIETHFYLLNCPFLNLFESHRIGIETWLFVSRPVLSPGCLNRTVSELKLRQVWPWWYYLLVWIAPYRNWNEETVPKRASCAMVWIAPNRNWNNKRSRRKAKIKGVWIAQYRNWNKAETPVEQQKPESLNRTVSELKHHSNWQQRL